MLTLFFSHLTSSQQIIICYSGQCRRTKQQILVCISEEEGSTYLWPLPHIQSFLMSPHLLLCIRYHQGNRRNENHIDTQQLVSVHLPSVGGESFFWQLQPFVWGCHQRKQVQSTMVAAWDLQKNRFPFTNNSSGASLNIGKICFPLTGEHFSFPRPH